MINTSKTPAVSLRDVELQYPDGTRALEGIDLDVQEGEFVTLLGPSGCGKSTLLRLAAGLEQATAGDINVKTEKIGFVFQEPALLPWRSVRENIRLFANNHSEPGEESRLVVDDAIELVGLKGFEDAKPHQLSGGMSMRASLARALVGKPELFLFDEPFGALDEFTRERLNDETQKIYAKSRFTGMFVTHSISEALFMGSRVVVMGARPSRIIAEFEVPVDFPRDPEVRYTKSFAELQQQISQSIRREMEQ